jgi:hypothetical protein
MYCTYYLPFAVELGKLIKPARASNSCNSGYGNHDVACTELMMMLRSETCSFDHVLNWYSDALH